MSENCSQLQKLVSPILLRMPFPENFRMRKMTPWRVPASSWPYLLQLFFRGRLVIPTVPMQQTLLHEFHSSPTAGHSGLQATLARLASLVYWQGMYKDAKNYIANCTTYHHRLDTLRSGLFAIDFPNQYIL